MRFVAALLALLLATNALADPSAPASRVELVPSVRRGHSIAWKTGAAITVTSIGVSLIGAALTIRGLPTDIDYGGTGGNYAMFIAGITISAIGDAGLAVAGPIVWMAGIGGRADD